MRTLGLLICLIISFSAFGQKRIMMEKFTNKYCGACPDASILIQNMVEEHPEVIWVAHHKPVTFTDNPLTNEQSIVLYNDLNLNGVPQGMVDRKLYGSNPSIVMSRSQWEQRVNTQLEEEPVFDISIEEVGYDPETRNLSFRVDVTALETPPEGPFRISAIMVEDSVWGQEQHSYFNDVPGHPLEGQGDIIWAYPHRNVARTIFDDPWGTADVIPDEPVVGQLYSKTYSYVVPEDFRARRLNIVASISQHHELAMDGQQTFNADRVYLRDIGVAFTDVEESSIFDDMRLSPNPTADVLRVSFPVIPDYVRIMNAEGKQFLEQVPYEKDISIDVNMYNDGSYFLIVGLKGKNYGRQFIIAR